MPTALPLKGGAQGGAIWSRSEVRSHSSCREAISREVHGKGPRLRGRDHGPGQAGLSNIVLSTCASCRNPCDRVVNECPDSKWARVTGSRRGGRRILGQYFASCWLVFCLPIRQRLIGGVPTRVKPGPRPSQDSVNFPGGMIDGHGARRRLYAVRQCMIVRSLPSAKRR